MMYLIFHDVGSINIFVDTSECRVDPCGENGTCYQGNGTYYCECIAGKTGRNCENGKKSVFKIQSE